jgi:c-di-GMP-related signal transduction protein
MAELLTELPVTDEITSALLHGHGRLGTTLDIIRACERNDRATLDDLAPGRHAELIALREAAVNGLTNDDPVRH